MQITDLSTEVAFIQAARKYDPGGFDARLRLWLQKTGFRFDPGWTTHQIIVTLDDNRIKSLAQAVTKALSQEHKK